MKSKLDQIIAQVAKDMNLKESLVHEVYWSLFEFNKKTIESGEFKGVQITHFGRFVVKPDRLDHLKNMEKKS